MNLVSVGTATPPRHRVRGSRRQRGSPSGTPESLGVPVCDPLAARPVSATEISSVPASAGPCEDRLGPQGPTLSRDPGVQNASSAFRLGWSLHSSRGYAYGRQATEAKAGSHHKSVSISWAHHAVEL